MTELRRKVLRPLLARMVFDWLEETGSAELFGCGMSGSADVAELMTDEFIDRWAEFLIPAVTALIGGTG
jgi:hypothetical protein